MRLSVDVLKKGPKHGLVHTDVSVVEVPESDQYGKDSLCGSLEGEEASRDPDVSVAVVVEKGVGRPASGERKSWDVLFDNVPFWELVSWWGWK